MAEAEEDLTRAEVRSSIQDAFNQTLDQRVERYLEVQHQGIIGNHHFARASSECLEVYRDGYFISAVMVSQSVAEGIFRFILDRNGISSEGDRPSMAAVLKNKGVISEQCAEAFVRIWNSFRNDVHHMNPKIASIPFSDLAKRNLEDLAIIEREIFAVSFHNGKLVPVHPKYWDLKPDGPVPVFLRYPRL